MWGGGKYGKLGLGDEENRSVPTEVPMFISKERAVVVAACGLHHTVAITIKGSTSQLYAWGYSGQYRCGVDDRGMGFFPRPREVDFFGNKPIGKVNIIAVEADSSQGLAFKVFPFHQSKRPVYWCSRIVALLLLLYCQAISISAGAGHNLALAKVEGASESLTAVFAWGENNFGQLGTGFHKPSVKPIKVMGFPISKTVTAVVCGGRHSMAIVAGSVFAWGCNGRLLCSRFVPGSIELRTLLFVFLWRR